MTTEEDRKRQLGALIRARRKHLHLTQDEVSELGGPAAATLRKIEAGKFGELRLGTTWPLERVLGWRPSAMSGFLMYADSDAIEAAIEPNYDAFRVGGVLPPGIATEVPVVPPGQDHRPVLNIDADTYRDMAPGQIAEMEHRLNAEAWRARREILGG